MPKNIPTAVVNALRTSKSVAVLTGAGVSAESGIPTFREAMTGLWSKYDPMELATPQAFARNPELVSRWYDERRQRCALVKPNPGHHAVARMERRLIDKGAEFTLLTQNVDRLHQAAGSRNVVELHGSIWEWRCQRCGVGREELGEAFRQYPPRCTCGGIRRPGVVWFGEQLPVKAVSDSERVLGKCDLFFSVGTSAVVQPAASFVYLAKRGGAQTVEINREPTPISDLVDWSIIGMSGEILPELVDRAFRA